MSIDVDVSGFTANKVVEGQTVSVHRGTLRLRSTDKLDVVVTGDGVKTVLQLLQETVAAITNADPGDPAPSEWDQLLSVPANSTEVTISLGARVAYEENV